MSENESNKLVLAAKNLQEKMDEAQQAIDALEITGGSDDVATATVNGQHQLLKVHLSDALVKKQDKILIEDAILAAYNDAHDALEEKSREILLAIAHGVKSDAI